MLRLLHTTSRPLLSALALSLFVVLVVAGYVASIGVVGRWSFELGYDEAAEIPIYRPLSWVADRNDSFKSALENYCARSGVIFRMRAECATNHVFTDDGTAVHGPIFVTGPVVDPVETRSPNFIRRRMRNSK